MEANKNHDISSHLHHTVVTVAEPTCPPSLPLPSLTVNKSRTVQEPQSIKFGFTRRHVSGFIVYS